MAVLFANWFGPVAPFVSHVFCLCSPSNVRQSVVGATSRTVESFTSFRPRANECFKNKVMHGAAFWICT